MIPNAETFRQQITDNEIPPLKGPPGSYKLLKRIGNKGFFDDIQSVLVSHEVECAQVHGPCADLKTTIKTVRGGQVVGSLHSSAHISEDDTIVRAHATYTDYSSGSMEEKPVDISGMFNHLEYFLD